MTFLQSQALGDSKAKWEAWAKRLSALNQRDPAVKFARKRTAAVLSRMAEHEKVEVQKSNLLVESSSAGENGGN